jgi:glycerophosphoryl diester phosphodiesterase
LEVSERFNHLNPSLPIYSNRFPMWKSSFQLNSLQEEIELIQGLQKSFSSIYNLDTNGELTKDKKEIGIYVEIKDPQFHKENNRANFSEIVLDILKQYKYVTKKDKAIIQCFEYKIFFKCTSLKNHKIEK